MSDRFAPGTRVRVKALHPPGHCRTPYYARGRKGVVLGVVDREPNPEELAYGRRRAEVQPVYRVRFTPQELWPEMPAPARDAVIVDIFESWLEPLGSESA